MTDDQASGTGGSRDPRLGRRRARRRDGPPGRGVGRGVAGRRPAGPAGPAATRCRRRRRATRAEGAGDSGLSRLIELHAFNAAGDAAVAISLAGTLFFQVPTGEARGQVALFLGLTMLPFAIVAPLIGPFLDRFSHGRRWAIGSTMAVRAFLCWVLADRGGHRARSGCSRRRSGVLVASKAYGVTRAAAVPRLVPAALTLVKANARISLAGVVGAAVSAPIAVLASTAGAEWSLRYAFVLFVLATILAIRLPARVDSSQGEEPLALLPGPQRRSPGPRTRRPDAGGRGVRAASANCGPRWLPGFLTMFMAFLLRENPIGGLDAPRCCSGLVIGAAGLGNTLGHRARLAAATRRPGR